MIYFLLIIMLNDSVAIESYPTLIECEMRREAVRANYPGVSTKCLPMEEKFHV